jgi:hypothetical protein
MTPGDRVERIEAREPVGATVLETGPDTVRIAYDEGGDGWWPPESLRPLPS